MDGEKGLLVSRLKYLREVKRKQDAAGKNKNEVQPIPEIISNAAAENEIEALKRVSISAETVGVVYDKLNVTRKYRLNLLKTNHEINLKEQFPFFFTHPDLVSINIRYCEKTVDTFL